MKCFGRHTKKNFLFYTVIFFVVIILYQEILTYYFNTWSWKKPMCQNTRKCTRILLVADPQIIGNYLESLHFVTPFSIHDSDRYLAKTYYYAFDFIDPDLVIFLGDLMDEGSIATDKDFYGYVKRVFNIFLKPAKYVKHIWLPGDNDIGGEGFDKVTSNKLKRFNRAFSQPDLQNVNNYTFFKVNVMNETIPVYKEKRDFYDTEKIFVALSHIPLLFTPNKFSDKVITKMLPQLIFSAHNHRSMIISTNALLREERQIVPVTPESDKIHELELGITDMYEILVPTCSYRMGTEKIGFGYALLENNNLRYSVLWSPSRFPQLLIYAIMLACLVGSCLLYCCCSLLPKHR